MDRPDKQLSILRTIAEFERIERYGRILPFKHALIYDEEEIERLAGLGLLEWVGLRSGCGKEVKGLRLTDAGRDRVYGSEATLAKDKGELPLALVAILIDVHCHERIFRHHGMMPKKRSGDYPGQDFDDLFQHGYILRIKVKRPGAKKREGYVLSAKSRRLLLDMGLIEKHMHLPGRPGLIVTS